MRLALSLLLVLTACATVPADPKALLDQWLDVVRRQQSVRFNVEIKVEGNDPRRRTYAGVQHINTGGGAVEQKDVTAHAESRWGVTDYRAMILDRDTYLQHNELTLPTGKSFAVLETQGASWTWHYLTSLSLNEQEYDPGSVFADLDRDTLRLVGHDGDRYEFSAGGVPHSGGYTQGEVRLVVEVDASDRVLKAERTGPSADRQQEHRIASYSQWGTAPDVLRPAAETVAKPAEVVVRGR
ncbi:hypothetical protein ABZX92_05155 [Lentzea sp. NPDC006480]|uniref:hypothetical protein n=1 Tax=Lentzea sp. NPDC006480 TaxID=3157176 RepID=UPI0033A70961